MTRPPSQDGPDSHHVHPSKARRPLTPALAAYLVSATRLRNGRERTVSRATPQFTATAVGSNDEAPAALGYADKPTDH